MEPERRSEVQRSARNPNWTTLALIGGLVLMIIVIIYFATKGNPDQDKLTRNEVGAERAAGQSARSREALREQADL